MNEREHVERLPRFEILKMGHVTAATIGTYPSDRKPGGPVKLWVKFTAAGR
jgi:hypothetical protein